MVSLLMKKGSQKLMKQKFFFIQIVMFYGKSIQLVQMENLLLKIELFLEIIKLKYLEMDTVITVSMLEMVG